MTFRTRFVSTLCLGTCCALLGVSLLCSSGCASSGRNASRSASASSSSASTDRSIATFADLDERYIIGPTATGDMGYRIAWQHAVLERNIKNVYVQDDSVFVLQDRNFLTRLDRDTGQYIWREPVADPLDTILGLVYLPDDDLVVVATGDSLLMYDESAGYLKQRQNLTKVASSGPVHIGPFMVYASGNGQVCWHSHEVNAPYKSYQVSSRMDLKPLYLDGLIVAASADGRVMVLDAAEVRQIWSRQMLDNIEAAPDAGDGAVFVADTAHTLSAFALYENRTPLWRHLFERPLTMSPVLLGDFVYQQVPGIGLFCLEAQPVDTPDGVVVWHQPDLTGTVIAQNSDGLLLWDANARTLTVVDPKYGDVIKSYTLPQVKGIELDSRRANEIVAYGSNGRVIRLERRNK
jgi:hypothetical protein